MSVIFNDSELDPIVFNRRVADIVNAAAWEALQLRTAGWCTTHPLVTAVAGVAAVALGVLASMMFPLPWWM